MFSLRKPIHCIIPPHILRALIENRDKRLREIGLRTLAMTIRAHERRSLLGRMPVTTAGGQKHRAIYDAQHNASSNPSGQLVRSEGDPPSSDQAVNQAYDGFGITYDFYQDVFNRNSVDDHGMVLKGFVHYGDKYDNAFWDGQEMIFGDGDGVIFTGFTGALDVIAHELTHGVTQNTANLEYHQQSGALNESFSDVFGSLVKQYHSNQDAASADWLIGAGILAPGIHGVALRSMKDPGSAYDDPKLGGKDPQPGRMEDFVEMRDDDMDDWGGVHLNSGIPNHAFYLVATEIGGNAWQDAGQIWYDALRQVWPTANFQDCANVTFQVAGQRFGTGSKQQQVVRSAWSEVGITIAEAGAAPTPRKPAGRAAAANRDDHELKKQLGRLALDLQKLIDVLK